MRVVDRDDYLAAGNARAHGRDSNITGRVRDTDGAIQFVDDHVADIGIVAVMHGRAGAFAGGGGDGELFGVHAPEIEHAEQQRSQDRHDERQFEQRRAPAGASANSQTRIG